MKDLSVWDQDRITGLNPEQAELVDYSVFVAGNEMSKKLIGRPFPHPDLESVATILALFQKEPKQAETLLKQRSRMFAHLFMRSDPQERTLKTLVEEYDLRMSFDECHCEYPDHSNAKSVCPQCQGLIRKKET